MILTLVNNFAETSINLPKEVTFYAYAWLIPLVSAGISAFSTYMGANKAAKEREKTEALQHSRYEEAKRLFDTEYNKNFLDTDTAKTSIKVARDNLKERFSNINNSAIKTGQTPESKLATAEEANKTYSNFLSSLSAQGTAYKQHLLDRWNNQQQFYDNLYYNNREAAAESFYNTGQNIGTAIGNAGQAIAAGLESNPKAQPAAREQKTTATSPAEIPSITPKEQKKVQQWSNTNHMYFPNSYIEGIKQRVRKNNKSNFLLDNFSKGNTFENMINLISKNNSYN